MILKKVMRMDMFAIPYKATVLRLSMIFRKHPAKLRQDIMRQHPVLPAKRSGTVSCGTMQIHRTGSSFKRRQTAGQQGRRHTGQYIPAAAPGKARVAGGIHACTAIRRSYNGAGTLEYHHDVPFFCILPGNFLTVGAELCHG